jgi:hypothetical protein
MDDIEGSMDELAMRLSETGEQVSQLLEVFSKANDSMGKSTDNAILSKLDEIIGQNEKIASAILALADMLKEINKPADEIPLKAAEEDDYLEAKRQWQQGMMQIPSAPPMPSMSSASMPQRDQMPQMPSRDQMSSMRSREQVPMPPLREMPQMYPPTSQQSAQQRPMQAPDASYQGQMPQTPYQEQPDDDLKPLPLYPPKRDQKSREQLRGMPDAPPMPKNPMPRPGFF